METPDPIEAFSSDEDEDETTTSTSTSMTATTTTTTTTFLNSDNASRTEDAGRRRRVTIDPQQLRRIVPLNIEEGSSSDPVVIAEETGTRFPVHMDRSAGVVNISDVFRRAAAQDAGFATFGGFLNSLASARALRHARDDGFDDIEVMIQRERSAIAMNRARVARRARPTGPFAALANWRSAPVDIDGGGNTTERRFQTLEDAAAFLTAEHVSNGRQWRQRTDDVATTTTATVMATTPTAMDIEPPRQRNTLTLGDFRFLCNSENCSCTRPCISSRLFHQLFPSRLPIERMRAIFHGAVLRSDGNKRALIYNKQHLKRISKVFERYGRHLEYECVSLAIFYKRINHNLSTTFVSDDGKGNFDYQSLLSQKIGTDKRILDFVSGYIQDPKSAFAKAQKAHLTNMDALTKAADAAKKSNRMAIEAYETLYMGLLTAAKPVFCVTSKRYTHKEITLQKPWFCSTCRCDEKEPRANWPPLMIDLGCGVRHGGTDDVHVLNGDFQDEGGRHLICGVCAKGCSESYLLEQGVGNDYAVRCNTCRADGLLVCESKDTPVSQQTSAKRICVYHITYEGKDEDAQRRRKKRKSNAGTVVKEDNDEDDKEKKTEQEENARDKRRNARRKKPRRKKT